MIRILLSTRLGERRYTQADLARMTQIRASTINDYYWELADRINLKHLDLICEALECDVSDIIVRVPDKECHLRPKTGAPKKPEQETPISRPEALCLRAFFYIYVANNIPVFGGNIGQRAMLHTT